MAQKLDATLRTLEPSLTHDGGLPRRPWFVHMIYAPGFYTGYGVKTLPGVREAIEQHAWPEAEAAGGSGGQRDHPRRVGARSVDGDCDGGVAFRWADLQAALSDDRSVAASLVAVEISNCAVSAIAITAITPACSGSVTTRSAASGTLPAMLRLITRTPRRFTSLTASVIAPPISAPASTTTRARGQPRDGADGRGQRLLADERNRVHRDALAADVVAIGLADGADGDLPDLCASADDDHALAVDRHQRRRFLDVPDDGQRGERVAQPRKVFGGIQLQVHREVFSTLPQAFDRADVGRMLRDHPRDLRERPRRVVGGEQQAVPGRSHGERMLTGSGFQRL